MGDLFNRDVLDLVRWMDDMKAEMLASQSSRLHRGFIHEEKRRYIELMGAMIKRLETMETGDFPEVHPVLLEPVVPAQ